jgi:hypothetical protein
VVAPETVRLFDRSVAQALLDWSSYEDEYDDDVGGRTEDGTDLAKRELLAKRVGSFRTWRRVSTSVMTSAISEASRSGFYPIPRLGLSPWATPEESDAM